MFPVALSHSFLKKVIIEIVEEEHRLYALGCGPELKKRALHGTFIVVRLRQDVLFEKQADNIGLI